MEIGRRIYFDLQTGNVLIDTGERQGNVRKTTIEQDVTAYTSLSERNRETFDYIELEYGNYAQDFAECNGYRINPDTKQIEFSYPDTNETEPSEPAYQEPLSKQVEELKQRTADVEIMLTDIILGGM